MARHSALTSCPISPLIPVAMAISSESAAKTEFGAISAALASRLAPLGFDSHPFLIGWYNERVGPKFTLPYGDATPAVVVLSRPDMFERTFVPFLVRTATKGEPQVIILPYELRRQAPLIRLLHILLNSHYSSWFLVINLGNYCILVKVEGPVGRVHVPYYGDGEGRALSRPEERGRNARFRVAPEQEAEDFGANCGARLRGRPAVSRRRRRPRAPSKRSKSQGLPGLFASKVWRLVRHQVRCTFTVQFDNMKAKRILTGYATDFSGWRTQYIVEFYQNELLKVRVRL